MARYNPIRTSNADLSRVQDRMRDTANATTARLDSLQSQVDAASAVTVKTISASTTVDADPDVHLVNTTAGMQLQLPDASKVNHFIRFKNLSSSNALALLTQTINGRQQLINGLAFFVVAVSSTVTFVSDGSNFHTL